jgi:predicted Zn-dependent peptidase
VILQEIGQTLDTPDDIVFDWLQEAPIPTSRSAAPSWARRARRALREGDLRRFVGEHYGPGQMILCAAGAVDHDCDLPGGRAALRASFADPAARR